MSSKLPSGGITSIDVGSFQSLATRGLQLCMAREGTATRKMTVTRRLDHGPKATTGDR